MEYENYLDLNIFYLNNEKVKLKFLKIEFYERFLELKKIENIITNVLSQFQVNNDVDYNIQNIFDIDGKNYFVSCNIITLFEKVINIFLIFLKHEHSDILVQLITNLQNFYLNFFEFLTILFKNEINYFFNNIKINPTIETLFKYIIKTIDISYLYEKELKILTVIKSKLDEFVVEIYEIFFSKIYIYNRKSTYFLENLILVK